MTKFLRWQPGRQGSGYFKMYLANWLFFDVLLLKFPTGSYIDPHTDPIPGKRHFRLNIFLKKAQKGGEFVLNCGAQALAGGSRWELFRPDIMPHYVTKIDQGTRYVLSIGWVRK